MRKMIMTCACLCALSACGAMPEKDAALQLTLTDHPLAEKIWDVKGERFIDKTQLLERAAQSRYLLLGETHDNLLHHRHQAEMIDTLAAKRRRAAVVFEMIDDKQGELLAEKPPSSVDALIATLSQVKVTWDYERNYRGVFEVAMKAGFAILPASLGREAIMGVARHGDATLPDSTKALLNTVTLSAEQEAQSRKEIESSHCGMLPEAMVSPMMFTQRVKDAVMAERLVAHSDVDVRVLVAGSGHARNDRGVPLYLAHESGVVTVAWAEVVPEETEARAYGAHWGSTSLPFDYVWFTPRVERPDPCAGMRQHMQKRQEAAVQ